MLLVKIIGHISTYMARKGHINFQNYFSYNFFNQTKFLFYFINSIFFFDSYIFLVNKQVLIFFSFLQFLGIQTIIQSNNGRSTQITLILTFNFAFNHCKYYAIKFQPKSPNSNKSQNLDPPNLVPPNTNPPNLDSL